MNNVYMHTKNTLRNIVLKNIILLIPLIIYGIYKNGYLLYEKNVISFLEIFKVLYLILNTLIVDLIRRVIFKKKLHIDLDFLICFIIPLLMPTSINIFLYFGLVFAFIFIYEFISKYMHFNKIAFIVFFIYLILLILGILNFQNSLESENIYVFNILDLFWGRNIGGIASSNIPFALIFLLVSSLINNYKYQITVSFLITYLILAFVIKGFDIYVFTNSIVIVGAILTFIDSRFTPDTFLKNLLYGIIIGILSSLFTIFINNYLGLFFSILLVSGLYNLLDKKFANCYKKCYNKCDF